MRILFAPHEICGQMQLFAETIRSKGHDATALSYCGSGTRAYQNDLLLDVYSTRFRTLRYARMVKMFAQAVRQYDVFHFFFGRSLLPRHQDLPWLKRMGKKVFVHFHGSDLRQRKYLRSVVRHRLIGRSPTADTPPSSQSQLDCLEVWRRFADGIFISIPELLPLVPEGVLLPQPIRLVDWPFRPEAAAERPQKVVIAHAPGSRMCKGTEHVITAVGQLQSEGLPVTLRLIENIPFSEVRPLYESAHIAVDQVIQGSYGHVAIEFMALGKPVVAHLDDWYHSNRPDLPILAARPLELTDRLRSLVRDQSRRIELGVAGRKYVERWHNVSNIGDQLLATYLTVSRDERRQN